jgi:D-glycero-alpha-D-manno-heptose-7-phosphate kinase
VTAKAKAPARISFGGGGTDLTPFFTQHGGAVLNATINRYSRCTLKRREDLRVKLVSTDFHLTVDAADAQSLVYDGNLDLIKAAIKLIRPNFGFDLEVSSDFPPSSGLGGSSVVLAAVIGCFNQFRNDRLDSYGIAELAFQAERIELKCSGGWQDQYAAVFGGFNFMEFRSERNEINSLRVPEDVQNELEDRLLLCFSGKAHPTRIIHDTQRDRMVNDEAVTAFAKRTRDLAYEMRYLLMRGQLDHFGKCMHDAWELKKNLSIGITDTDLDEIYAFARAHGAIGGKILGAGGGGFFLFQSEKNQRSNLARAFKDRGLESHHCMFEDRGLRSWIVKS